MFEVGSDLQKLYLDNGIETREPYNSLMARALGPGLAYGTPAMYGVTATVLHPGVVRTSFGREDSGRWMRLMLPVVRPFMKSPEAGARTSVHLASAPEVEGVTGRYYVGTEPKRSSRASYDADAAARLWDVSARLVGLDPGRAA